MTTPSPYIASVLGSKVENKYAEQLFNLSTETIHTTDQIASTPKFFIFWGGEDICPYIYNEIPTDTHAKTISLRDEFETEIFNYAIKNNIPMLGICRGAQLLCALSGGKLWQHVSNHGDNNSIVTHDKKVFTVPSTHHQMMRPTPEMKLLAVSRDIRSPIKWNDQGKNKSTEPEAEIIFIPKTKALCIQSHPEYTDVHSKLSKLTIELVKEYL